MRHFRDSRLRPGTVVLAALLVVATGCGTADNLATTYADDLVRAVGNSGSKIKNPMPWLQPGKTAASQTDDLTRSLANTPEDLADEIRRQPDLAAVLQRARSTKAAIDKVDLAAAAAADIGANLSSEARQGASLNASVRSPGNEEVVAGMGEEILKDLICSAATDMMAPDEKAEIDKHSSAFTYLRDKSAKAILDALTGRAAGRLGADFHRGFRWGAYGANLAGDANRHLASIEGQIESPDWRITRAYIFVVKTCMAPPAR